MDLNAERFVYFTTGDDYTTQTNKAGILVGDESDPNREDDNQLVADLVGGTADYQETPAGSGNYSPEVDQLAVRVPPVPIRWSKEPGGTVIKPYPAARRYFLARTERYRAHRPMIGT